MVSAGEARAPKETDIMLDDDDDMMDRYNSYAEYDDEKY